MALKVRMEWYTYLSTCWMVTVSAFYEEYSDVYIFSEDYYSILREVTMEFLYGGSILVTYYSTTSRFIAQYGTAPAP